MRRTQKSLNKGNQIKSSKVLPGLDIAQTNHHQQSIKVYTSAFMQQQAQFIKNGAIDFSLSPEHSRREGDKIKPFYTRDSQELDYSYRKAGNRSVLQIRPNKFLYNSSKALMTIDKTRGKVINS